MLWNLINRLKMFYRSTLSRVLVRYCLSAVFCWIAVFSHDYAMADNKKKKVVVLMNLPLDIVEAKSMDVRKKIFEEELQDELEVVKSLDVDIVTRKDLEKVNRIEEFAQTEGYHYYIDGDFKPPLPGTVGAWALKLEFGEVSPHTKIEDWRVHHPEYILIAPDSGYPELDGYAKKTKEYFFDFKSEIEKDQGPKIIFTSCFEADEKVDKSLQKTLPIDLACKFFEVGLDDRGYKIEYMSVPEVGKYCIRTEDTSLLDDKKHKSDYVIEGHIYMADQEFIGIIVYIYKMSRNEPLRLARFRHRLKEKHALAEKLAAYIKDNWKFDSD